MNRLAVVCLIAHHDEDVDFPPEFADPHIISLSFMPSTNAARPTSVMQ
jgi:hypothetical protein